LADFFEPYLTSTEIPQIAYEYELTDGPNGEKTHLSLVLKQVQGLLFDNIFPVVISGSGESTTVYVHLSGSQATLEHDFTGGEISGVAIDPDQWVLWEPAGGSTKTVGLVNIYPNPSFETFIYLRFFLEETSPIVLRIYNALGAEVAFRDLGQVSPTGTLNEIVWDKKDNSGARVASGVYWATLEIAGKRSVRNFSVIH